MSYQKLADLALKLSDKTNKGQIEWEETAQKGTYQTEINENSVQISEVEAEDFSNSNYEKEYEVSIFNSSGNKVESFRWEDIHQLLPGDVHGYILLQEMYQTARRMALGTEQVLDSILGALDDDKIPF
ncbi:hypothetical protein [Thalassospira xiamenensis]|uniref:hypothetical protein n=1 Tax=Thalassospira xiamenensis TaxID=220697 RepID=UPI001FFEF775|nr:hypothetical protein [Thalassospira xiamenensis]MCK2165159.1 hypothetical protein [Thalassospira xiamenensis]